MLSIIKIIFIEEIYENSIFSKITEVLSSAKSNLNLENEMKEYISKNKEIIEIEIENLKIFSEKLSCYYLYISKFFNKF